MDTTQLTAPSAYAPPSYGLVVEDMPATRDWLRRALEEAFPGMPVYGAATLAQAQHSLEQRQHDSPNEHALALVDLRLPDGSGLEFIQACQATEIIPIVTTIYDDDDSVFEALQAGAQGYLLKDHSLPHMVRYLRRINQGEPPLSPLIARRILKALSSAVPIHEKTQSIASAPHALSPRETEILGLIGQGLRVKEVADTLQLARSTVASYIKCIYKKLNITSRAQAALQAQRLGLIAPVGQNTPAPEPCPDAGEPTI